MGVCYGLWIVMEVPGWFPLTLQLVGDIHQRWLRSPFLGREDGTNTKHRMHMECTWNAHETHMADMEVCLEVCLMRFYEFYG